MSDLREQLDELKTAVENLGGNPAAEDLAPLEEQARELLSRSKNTPHEEEARELFTRLAQISATVQPVPVNTGGSRVRKLLRQARIRIEIAGDNQDFDEAIDILAQALELAPENPEIHELLAQAAGRTPQHRMKVQGLMTRYGLSLPGESASAASPPPPPEQPVSSSAETPPEKPVESVGTISDTDTLLSEIASAYYAGDYNRTIELANRLLVKQPDHEQADEYRQKASDNLMRGIVPDHRIPFDARVAYNRANSLVRAGNYDEAQRLYREAREIAERAGIQSWKDVEQALLEIQDLALAREYLSDGDRLLAADDWSGARAKYEASLRVVPNDPEVEERLALVKKVQEQYEQANVQLNMIGGTLPEQADALKKLLGLLSVTRQILPGSERLQQIVFDTQTRIQQVKSQLVTQGESLMNRLEMATGAEERQRIASDAAEIFDLVVELDPADNKAIESLQQARQVQAELSGARQTLEQAAAMIARNTESELAQARQILNGMQSQAQDPRYRGLVDDLMSRYMDRAAEALDNRDVKTAERWLATLKDDPFRILGRRTELLRLEDEVRGLKQARLLRGVVVIGVVLVLVAIIAVLSRDTWQPELFPPEPTDTPTATASNTPTVTPVPPDTATPTATATASPEPAIRTQTAAVTATFIAEETIFAGTIVSQDQTATRAARATEIQATNIVRTEAAQSTLDFIGTLTATHSPSTATPSPSVTVSPSPSPTQSPILCRVVLLEWNFINIRSDASSAAQFVRRMERNEEADVTDIKPDITGAEDDDGDVYIWYKISMEVGDAAVTGWIRSDLVTAFPECPSPEELD